MFEDPAVSLQCPRGGVRETTHSKHGPGNRTEGQVLELSTIIDAFTRESVDADVAHRICSAHAIDQLVRLTAVRGATLFTVGHFFEICIKAGVGIAR
ncbi:MAG: hypothetical protein ACI9BW_002038 [Gammaproteobacteria bacterium]|jgi:hypothetical protein